MTLLHMATQQPDRIEQMVLIGATSYFPQQARGLMRRYGQEKFSGAALARLREIHARGDEQIRHLQENFYVSADSYQDMNFTSPLLSTIKAETLIIQGDRDEFFPIEIALDMYRSIPRSYLWIIPNGGHIPVFAPLRFGVPEYRSRFLRRQIEGPLMRALSLSREGCSPANSVGLRGHNASSAIIEESNSGA